LKNPSFKTKMLFSNVSVLSSLKTHLHTITGTIMNIPTTVSHAGKKKNKIKKRIQPKLINNMWP